MMTYMEEAESAKTVTSVKRSETRILGAWQHKLLGREKRVTMGQMDTKVSKHRVRPKMSRI